MSDENKKTIVTRFPPSPTGMFHVGSIRTVLYNYLFAQKNEGKYILRCEDTDKARSKKEYEEYFLEVFKWLNLPYDEYYRQSERSSIYRKYLELLIEKGDAYISKETPKEPGQRDEVIRFKNPNKVVSFHDAVIGDISFDTTELGDFVIARDLDNPVYHFAVVVDDYVMGITHIIRGQDHVSNTPRQILIQEAIGAPRPVYAHASLILNNERAKLSKRDPLVRPSLEYRDEGYLPDALLNFMALLGWNPGTDQEIFTREELISAFTIERMQKQSAIFNPEKLEWINKEHMKRLDIQDQKEWIQKYLPREITTLPQYTNTMLEKITPTLMERITHFGQIREMVDQGEIAYFFSPPQYIKEKMFWKQETDTIKLSERLHHTSQLLQEISEEDFTAPLIKDHLGPYTEKEGRGQVLWPLRYALSGREKSPDPFQLAEIFGKKETLQRIAGALQYIAE